MSHVWSREEDTLSPTGDETVSDVKALIRETPVRRSYVGKKRQKSKYYKCVRGKCCAPGKRIIEAR